MSKEGKRYKHIHIKDVVYTVRAYAPKTKESQLREGHTNRTFWVTEADLKKYYKEYM